MHIQYTQSAGDIFIQEITELLKDLPGVDIVADDILVYGSNIQKHNTTQDSNCYYKELES